MAHIEGSPTLGHGTTPPVEKEDDAPDFGQGTEAQNRTAINVEFAGDPFDWATLVGQRIALSMGAWGDANGVGLDFIGQLYGQHSRDMFNAIYSDLFAVADRKRNEAGSMAIMRAASQQEGFNVEAFGAMGMGSAYYTSTFEGMDAMVVFARQWMSARAGMELAPAPKGGSGRGRGRGGPTAEDIRNQFDVDELARGVNDMNRGLVLEDHADAKGVARKYIDAVVAGKGEKRIDFETFVRGKIEATSRYKNIYARKPESVSAEAYMAPYLNSAMQLASPDEAAEIAIGGVQFGASAETFRQRLGRTENATGSAPFINQLESRMSNVSAILKG